MIRLQVKVLGVLLFILAAFVFSASSVIAGDILEFIDIPTTDARQAAVEPILTCRNGFMFEFHAIDKLAKQKAGPHQWDISFAKADGKLLIKEYPLWLGQAEVPLVRDGIPFPYAGSYTLLWNETVPVAPLSVCYSGAGPVSVTPSWQLRIARSTLGWWPALRRSGRRTPHASSPIRWSTRYGRTIPKWAPTMAMALRR